MGKPTYGERSAQKPGIQNATGVVAARKHVNEKVTQGVQLERRNTDQRKEGKTLALVSSAPIREKHDVQGLVSAIGPEPIRKLETSSKHFLERGKQVLSEFIVGSSKDILGGSKDFAEYSICDDEHKSSTRNRCRRSRRIESQSAKKKTPTMNADLAAVIDLDISSVSTDDSSDDNYSATEGKKSAEKFDAPDNPGNEDTPDSIFRQGLSMKRNLHYIEVLQSGHVTSKVSRIDQRSERPNVYRAVRKRRTNLITDVFSSKKSGGEVVQSVLRGGSHSVETVSQALLNLNLLKRKVERILDGSGLSISVSKDVVNIMVMGVRQRVCDVFDSACEFALYLADVEKAKLETVPAGPNLAQIPDEERNEEERGLIAQKELRIL